MTLRTRAKKRRRAAIRKAWTTLRPAHDGGYHLLFSFPRLVTDLLRGFIDEAWVEVLDFSTLERVNAKLHGGNLLRCDGDMVWRVKLKTGGHAYIFVVLEFQSNPDHWMAVRMAAAVLLLYLHLIRESQRPGADKSDILAGGLLPPVFPLVLYNGTDTWRAEQDAAKLIAELPGLEGWSWRPSIRYHVLSEQEVPRGKLGGPDNLVAVLFALEQCRTLEDVQAQIFRLATLLQGEENAELRRAFITWITSVVAVARQIPVGHTMIRPLSEEKTMLSDVIKDIEQKMINNYSKGLSDGETKGEAKGEARGEARGEAKALIRLIERRFSLLSPDQRTLIMGSDLATLERWFDRAIDAPNLDAVFAEPTIN